MKEFEKKSKISENLKVIAAKLQASEASSVRPQAEFTKRSNYCERSEQQNCSEAAIFRNCLASVYCERSEQLKPEKQESRKLNEVKERKNISAFTI